MQSMSPGKLLRSEFLEISVHSMPLETCAVNVSGKIFAVSVSRNICALNISGNLCAVTVSGNMYLFIGKRSAPLYISKMQKLTFPARLTQHYCDILSESF